MPIPNTNVSWTSFDNEFGGTYPAGKNIHEGYYCRSYYVPDITTNSTVPYDQKDIAVSKLKGAVKQTFYSTDISLTGVQYYDAYNSQNWSQLDGGTTFNTWTDVYSNTITSVTTPNVSYPLKMGTSGFYMYLTNGYRWYNDGYNTSYFYDHSRNPGIAIFDVDGTTIIGSSNSTDFTDYWYNGNPQNGSNYVPGITAVAVQPNTTYTIRFKINWYNGSAGRNGTYVSGSPYATVYNY